MPLLFYLNANSASILEFLPEGMVEYYLAELAQKPEGVLLKTL